MNEQKTITGIKGFDKDLKCRGFQFEVGKEFIHEGEVKPCSSGFHFCENPFDVFGYYPPSENRFCEVEGSGKTENHNSDSKIACSHLKIKAEINLQGLIKYGVKFILERVKWEEIKKETGDQSAATNTGYRSAATNTGDQSAATNTGDRSAATNTGYRSAATVEGKESIAIVTGYAGKAKGRIGCWLVLTERDDEYNILSVVSKKVDGKKVKEDTFYTLENGKFKICQ